MAKAKKTAKDVAVPKDKLLSRFTVFFFDKSLLTAILWICLTIFGALSYTTWMKREGFPSVNIPLAIVGGTYFVNDSAKVDSEVAKPISEIVLKDPNVNTVQTNSLPNFFTVSVTFNENVNAKEASAKLEEEVKNSGKLPEGANAQFNVPYFGATGGDTEKIDVALSFYSDKDTPLTELTAKAEAFAKWFNEKNIETVDSVFVKSPFSQSINPATGQPVTLQDSFDHFVIKTDSNTEFHDSVIVGISAIEGADVLKLDEQVRHALEEFESSSDFEGYNAHVSASFAPTIEESISELQKVLFEGLLAVLIVGSIVIAVRASIITVISMVTVVAITLGFLYAIGYSLNVITLFSLILALALIVDDTIIMVEAIDAARHHHKDRRRAIKEATQKVSRAMVAATLTAALSFAPFLFVGGVLGSFIKAIPITVISSLIISLLVALMFIPFFSRFLLLGKKQMGKKGVVEVAAGFEARLADFITKPMIWARGSHKKLMGVGLTAVFIGLGFVMAGLIVARNVPFNIFPPTKDTNGISINLSFPAGTSIEEADRISAEADQLAVEVLGDNFVQSSYFATGSDTGATQSIEIISYNDRDVSSPELVNQLQAKFDSDFPQATTSVYQQDIGPPATSFVVQIKADDRESAFKAANDIQVFMESTELKRPNGTTAKMVNVTVSNPIQYIRVGNQPIITVSAGFDGDDTSTLVSLAETAVEDEFDSDKLATYGLPSDALMFDIGQESDNQDSFLALALAFPVLLLVMYMLLGVQFRSFLQPILIFLAIPFSLFGIALGLDITSNSFSFFAMLGFFALLGLSIKNTILLTDFANQARRSGLSAVDSAVAALRERFRPLFATSATAVVSLIPLAISSPFWEALAVVLIFGLLSSTLLVVTVFPYYYLGAEYAREKVSPSQFLMWFATPLFLIFAFLKLFNIL